MYIRYLFHFVSIILLAAPVFSQNDSSKVSDRRYFSYTYANDFFNMTDRYYTQGIKGDLILPAFRKLPLMKSLFTLSNSVRQYGLTAVQDCFTPASIRRDTILKGDRPFAATMYLGHFIISNREEKKQRLTSEIDIGAIGPCAVCEEEQKAIHRSLVNIQPLGWQFQISNDILLNYRMRYEQNLFSQKKIDLTGLAELNAGTIYDNMALGANLRLGKMQSYFANTRTKKFQLYGFAQGWVKGVAYNATMQGGFFSKSINTLSANEIAPVVLRGSLGICLSYKKIYLEYTRTYISREIKTWWPHGWGHITISFYF
jgi:lipid A 3-O-deacylase